MTGMASLRKWLALCIAISSLGGCGESETQRAARLEREREQLLNKNVEGKPIRDWIYQLEKTDFWAQRASAARELGKMGEDARVAVGALAQALDDEATKVRLQTARALGNLGPIAREAEPALTKRQEAEEDDEVRAAIDEALTKIRGGS